MISKEQVVARKNALPYRIIEEEAVLVDIKEGSVIHLNEVAAVIWESIREPRRVEELITGVCALFDVDGDNASSDVIGFIEELRGAGLVTVT